MKVWEIERLHWWQFWKRFRAWWAAARASRYTITCEEIADNLYASPDPLTEQSIEELVAKLWDEKYVIKPDRFIVPPWVLHEIEEQFGVPVTVEKYHKWNAKRLGISEFEYWKRVNNPP